MENLTAEQGSQPHFGAVRVGIMRLGIKQGVPTAQLALRSPDDQRVVDVAQGETVLVRGEGSITVTGVHRGETPDGRDSVDLQWEALTGTAD